VDEGIPAQLADHLFHIIRADRQHPGAGIAEELDQRAPHAHGDDLAKRGIGLPADDDLKAFLYLLLDHHSVDLSTGKRRPCRGSDPEKSVSGSLPVHDREDDAAGIALVDDLRRDHFQDNRVPDPVGRFLRFRRGFRNCMLRDGDAVLHEKTKAFRF